MQRLPISMRHFRGRPLSVRVVLGRLLMLLGLVLVGAFMGWMVYS
jgi:hypothetical protein